MEIVILDFGGQYVFNIKRTLLEKGFDAEIVPYNISTDQLSDIRGIILSGGPYSVYNENSPLCDPDIFKLGLPLLGLCYGHQVIAHLLGGKVRRGRVGEYGFSEVHVDKSNILFKGLSDKEICWMSHGDLVSRHPLGFKIIASSKESRVAALQGRDIIFGLQFHPEVSHTPKGHVILENFARLCGCSRRSWDVRGFIEDVVKDVKRKIGYGFAITAVSGGVDSTTVAMLASKAIMGKLACIHINQGLMRKGESEEVVKLLRRIGLNIVYIDARKKFVKALHGIAESDDKRKIVGKLFIEEFEEAASNLGATWLIQGTIAPDIIESTRGEAKRISDIGHDGLIKIHHNVAGLPKGMKLKLIEPLSPLFKYQVRILAKELGLSKEMADRQPFPGPGLSCRISGEITKEKLKLMRNVNYIIERELATYRSSQYFAIMLTGEVKDESYEGSLIASKYLDRKVEAYQLKDEAIGVKGDERVVGNPLYISVYGNFGKLDEIPWVSLLEMQNELTGAIQEICRVLIRVSGNIDVVSKGYGITIRAVDTLDFMTAIPSKISFKHLSEVGDILLGKFDEIDFVCYEITTKPAATIELI